MNSIWPSALLVGWYCSNNLQSQSVSDLCVKRPSPPCQKLQADPTGSRVDPQAQNRLHNDVFDSFFFCANHSPSCTPVEHLSCNLCFHKIPLQTLSESQLQPAKLRQLVQLMDLAHHYKAYPHPQALSSQQWCFQSTNLPAVFALTLADPREQPLIWEGTLESVSF